MEINILDDLVQVSFDEMAKEPVAIVVEGSEPLRGQVLEALGLETVARGHFLNTQADYPGNIQMALNQAFDLDLEVSGAFPPPAPEGAND